MKNGKKTQFTHTIYTSNNTNNNEEKPRMEKQTLNAAKE